MEFRNVIKGMAWLAAESGKLWHLDNLLTTTLKIKRSRQYSRNLFSCMQFSSIISDRWVRGLDWVTFKQDDSLELVVSKVLYAGLYVDYWSANVPLTIGSQDEEYSFELLQFRLCVPRYVWGAVGYMSFSDGVMKKTHHLIKDRVERRRCLI